LPFQSSYGVFDVSLTLFLHRQQLATSIFSLLLGRKCDDQTTTHIVALGCRAWIVLAVPKSGAAAPHSEDAMRVFDFRQQNV